MKKLLLMLVMFTATLSAYSQQKDNEDREGRRERIETLRVGYFTDELSLSVEQSQTFWPLFNEYSDALRALNRRSHDLFKKIKDETVTISEANEWLEIEQSVVKTKRDYQVKFLAILSADQLAKMYAAEEGFKQELLRTTYKRRD
ncbi:MAG: hypothetical protein R3Y49_03400 [Rikenellaceae bacterium]